MFLLDGVWHESTSDLVTAHPSAQIHDSVHDEIAGSHVWAQSRILPRDKAADSSSKQQYDVLSRENNSEFGKALSLSEGKIRWTGSLALHSTGTISKGEEIFATRGYEYWSVNR